MHTEVTELKIKTENMIDDVKVRFKEIESHISQLKAKAGKLDELDSLVKMYESSFTFQMRKL